MTTTNQASELPDGGDLLANVTGWVDQVPATLWKIAVVATAIGLLAALLVGRRAAKRMGKRHAKAVSPAHSADNNNNNTEEEIAAHRDRQLLILALTPAGLFWLAVLVGSGRGLTAFGRDTLDWHHGWDWLVPATLDGVAVTFAVLAFRALWKQRNPDRARRIVWMSTGASAFINFFHELTKTAGHGLGAVYLAILSIMGMAILDEFLAQFEEGAGYIKREKPRFGLRWITLPYPTLCAFLAWTNYPPVLQMETAPDGTERPVQVTVTMAIEHLDLVRNRKAERRNERDVLRSAVPIWTRVAPWVRARKLQALLDRSNRSAAAERHTTEQRVRAEQDKALQALRSELTGALEQQKTEHETERAQLILRATEAERQRSGATQQARDLEIQLSGKSEQATGASQLVQQERQRAQEAEQKAERSAVQVREALVEARKIVEAEQRSAEQRERQLRSEMTELRQHAEQAAAELRSKSEQETADLLRQLEEERSTGAEQIKALRSELAEHADNVTRLRSNGARDPERSTGARSNGARNGGAPNRSTGARSNGAGRYDTELGLMFLEHPDHDFAWTTREVNKITNAGFSSKAPNLVSAAQHHYEVCPLRPHGEQCFEHAAQLAVSPA